MHAAGPMRVAIIGAGYISSEYAGNLATYADVDLVAIADTIPARAQQRAREFAIPRAGSVAEVLDDDTVEMIVNLTPPKAHAEVSTQALTAGKHVWSEKPMALARESARQLLDTAARFGTRIAVAPDTFLGSGTQAAMRTIRQAALGRPFAALSLMQRPGPELWHPNPEFLFAVGGGPVFDVGPYYLTALANIFGSVNSVVAHADRAAASRTIGSGPRAGTVFPVEVPTHLSALLEFRSGAHAECLFSFDSGAERSLLEVYAPEGAITFPDPNEFDGEVTVTARGGEAQLERPALGPAYRGAGVVDFARAIRAGVRERASGLNAYHIVDVMVAIHEAAETGTRVTVSSDFDSVGPLPDGWDPRQRTLGQR